MAFVAGGFPMSVTTNGFSPKTVLAVTKSRMNDPRVGSYVEALQDGKWYKAEILDVRPVQFRVHHTDKGSTYDKWIPMNMVRKFTYVTYPAGTRVEIQGATSGKWFPGVVLQAPWEWMHYVHFDNYSAAWDEWASSERVALPAGDISGAWQSDWGAVILTAEQNGKTIMIKGYWDQGDGKRGVITSGTYDPSERKLKFTYYEDWNKKYGSGTLILSKNARTFSGSYEQPGGGGEWLMGR